MSPVSLSLVGAVRFGLPGAVSAPDGPLIVDDAVVDQACAHRVEGLLWRALDNGGVTAPEAVAARAHDAHLQALRTCLAVEEVAIVAAEALGDRGIAARVLKGIAMAHLDYENPQDRTFGDADLLIRRADVPAAMASLHAAGFTRALPAVRQTWERRFSKAVMMTAPNGYELDLHLALAGGYFGEVFQHQRLWQRSGALLIIAGRALTALDKEDRLVHACIHAVLGGNSGMRVRRDIAQLVLVAQADWQVSRHRAIVSGCDSVLAIGITQTWAALQLDPAHPALEWAAQMTVSPEQQRALVHYGQASGRGWAPEARSTLAALNWRDQTRFIAGLVAPSRASLAARRRSRAGHFGRALRGIITLKR